MRKRIAQITDLHLEEAFPIKNGISAKKRLKIILKDIKREGISEIICTGDIGENGGVAYLFEQLQTTSLSITLGNHDSFVEISKYFSRGAQEETQKLYSSQEREYFKFLYLDSSAGIIDREQLLWLKKELLSSKPILIFLHHPIIGLNLKVDQIGRLENREEVVHLLEKSSSEINIFCGHYHLESTLAHNNIIQHITPAISFQIKKNKNAIEIDTTVYGYRIIELEKGNISSKIKRFTNAD